MLAYLDNSLTLMAWERSFIWLRGWIVAEFFSIQ